MFSLALSRPWFDLFGRWIKKGMSQIEITLSAANNLPSVVHFKPNHPKSHPERRYRFVECVWGSHASICHTVCWSGPGTLRTGYSLLLSFGWPPGANEISTHRANGNNQRRHDDTVVVAVWTRREKNHVKRYCHGLISTISGELIWLNRTTATQKGDDTHGWLWVSEWKGRMDEIDWNGAV